MTRNIITLVCLLAGINLYGQNLKTGVLVVGSTPSAISAAVQSARSGVKTLLIDAGKFDAITLTAADTLIGAGIYREFRKHADSLQKNPSKGQTFTPAFTARIFKGLSDTVKNLTVLSGAAIRKIEKSRRGWEIDLADREIKADVVVDATETQSVIKMALLKIDQEDRMPISSLPIRNLYRTSVAIARGAAGFETVPLYLFTNTGAENLLTAAPSGSMNLLTGQAAGATAAYCVFFNTTTKNLSVRKIQSELLSFKSRIAKFDDMAENDSSMIALQHIGVTGILKADNQEGKNLFRPDASVSTEELKPALKEYYSRSHVWFLDHEEGKLTLETALDLIRFLASRGEELNREVEKAWRTSLKIRSPFDLKKELTRRELAILLDTYLQPFSVEVDIEGNVRR